MTWKESADRQYQHVSKLEGGGPRKMGVRERRLISKPRGFHVAGWNFGVHPQGSHCNVPSYPRRHQRGPRLFQRDGLVAAKILTTTTCPWLIDILQPRPTSPPLTTKHSASPACGLRSLLPRPFTAASAWKPDTAMVGDQWRLPYEAQFWRADKVVPPAAAGHAMLSTKTLPLAPTVDPEVKSLLNLPGAMLSHVLAQAGIAACLRVCMCSASHLQALTRHPNYHGLWLGLVAESEEHVLDDEGRRVHPVKALHYKEGQLISKRAFAWVAQPNGEIVAPTGENSFYDAWENVGQMWEKPDENCEAGGGKGSTGTLRPEGRVRWIHFC